MSEKKVPSISREKYFSYLENGIPYEGYVEGLGYALKEIEVVPTKIHAREQILSIAYKAALMVEMKKEKKRREEKQKAIQAVSDHFNKKKRELGLFDPKNKEKILELDLYYNRLKSKIENEQPIERDEIPMELFYGPEGEMIHRMFQKEEKEPDFFGVPIRFTDWFSDIYSSYAGRAINTQREEYENYLAKGLNSNSGRLLMHEFGHYLQRKKRGGLYYSWIATNSLFNIHTKEDYDYNRTWTEVDANTRSYLYFGSPSSFWNFYYYPIDEKVKQIENLIEKHLDK